MLVALMKVHDLRELNWLRQHPRGNQDSVTINRNLRQRNRYQIYQSPERLVRVISRSHCTVQDLNRISLLSCQQRQRHMAYSIAFV